MRKIYKSPNVPPTLQNAPIPANAAEVKTEIYKAEDVRQQLLTDQYSKCAYCECSVTKNYNDVEHYRPKTAYFWLGHTWNNLLYSCDLCNRTYKKDFFPLVDETKRVSAPEDVSGEEPLIINPAEIEPSGHIRFNRHIMVHLTPQGKKTIELFHLNDREERPELINNREMLFELYEKISDTIIVAEKALQRSDITEDGIKDAMQIIELCNATIERLKSPSNAYSGMLVAQI